MSQENVEIARRAMDALNQSDLMVGGTDPLPTLREFCDPEIEWDFSRRGVDLEVYHGYDGWLRIAAQFGEAWPELRVEIEEIIDAGNDVVLFSNMIGLSKSGVKLSQRVGQVWTFHDGKIVRDEYFGEDHLWPDIERTAASERGPYVYSATWNGLKLLSTLSAG